MDGSFHIKNVYTQVKSRKNVYIYYVFSNLILRVFLKTFRFKPVVFNFNSLNLCL